MLKQILRLVMVKKRHGNLVGHHHLQVNSPIKHKKIVTSLIILLIEQL
jgi:hypothetical protein